MSNVSASAPALPSATIIPLPIQPRLLDLDRSKQTFDQAFVVINLVSQFVDMPDANIDRALAEMSASYPDAVERMIRESGEVLQNLRDATAFLAAIDLRLQAAAYRMVERELGW